MQRITGLRICGSSEKTMRARRFCTGRVQSSSLGRKMSGASHFPFPKVQIPPQRESSRDD